MKRILFSPIGTADPMTVLGDGPMLNIVRWYKPDEVVLFLSPKMAGYHETDNRYVRAIDDCCELCSIDRPVVNIIKSSHDEVHRFDCYIEEFEAALQNLQDSGEEVEILANATSGTPGMQQALVSLGAFGRFNMKLLQVTTPRKDASKQGDREDPDNYEYDRLWENNPDNEPNRDRRAKPVETPNFSEQLLRKNIIELVKNYDYQAAGQLADCSTAISPTIKQLIHAAASRLTLDPGLPTKAFSKKALGVAGLGYRCGDTLYEYIQVLEVKLKQGKYDDFVRSLTPAITETMLSALEPGLPLKSYAEDKALKEKNEYRFSKEKIKDNTALETFLKEKCNIRDLDKEEGPGPFVTNRVLMRLLRKYRRNLDGQYLDKLKRIDSFESSVRNTVTHQIRKLDKASLEHDGGEELQTVFELLCELNSIEPGLYDRINGLILNVLSEGRGEEAQLNTPTPEVIAEPEKLGIKENELAEDAVEKSAVPEKKGKLSQWLAKLFSK